VTLLPGITLDISFSEPGQQHIVAVDGADPVPALLSSEVFLPQGIADEELAALDAEGPGMAHPTPQVMAGVSRLRELRGQRAPGGSREGSWRPLA
jgi:hypothetical protein